MKGTVGLKKVEDTWLIDIDGSDKKALEEHRRAFLDLRRNTMDGILTIAKGLCNGPQYICRYRLQP